MLANIQQTSISLEEERINDVISHYNILNYNSPSIIAGHYCVAEELIDLSNDGESEIQSFEFGVNLYSQLLENNKNPNLVLFINDIGISKEQRKAFIENYNIPDNYLSILNRYEITPEQLDIQFESSIRNRASKEIRKLKKSNSNLFEFISSTDPRLVRCVDPAAFCEVASEQKEAITIKGPDNEYLVVKEGSNPKCNTILATLFNNLERTHSSDAIINCFNVIYVNRIKLGEFVANKLFNNMPDKINIFFDENGAVL